MVSNREAPAIFAYFHSNAISIVFKETTSETGHVADLKGIQKSIKSFTHPFFPLTKDTFNFSQYSSSSSKTSIT